MFVGNAKSIQGDIQVPGDKSLSHRAFLFSAMACGTSKIEDPLLGADVLSTIACLRKLGVDFTAHKNSYEVKSRGFSDFSPPTENLDCGNSGTSMRLLMGVLAGCPFDSVLTGDESLSKRPMARISDPLKLMNAQIDLSKNNFAPIKMGASTLNGIDFSLPIASAQLKSALILAGLGARGTTRLSGKLYSRDHTERLLPHYGAKIQEQQGHLIIEGGQKLSPADFKVPGDPSSAAFWAAAVLMLDDSQIKLRNVLLNPTRIGFFKVLERMGADISYNVISSGPELVGDIVVRSSKLSGVEIGIEEIPALIDEIPMLAVLATKAFGVTKVTGAEELRVKESDRLMATEKNLQAMGVEIEVFRDGFSLTGQQKLKGAKIETFHDHRIAMCFSIAALCAEGETEILDSDIVDVSYPGFFETLKRLTHE